jgi:predicted DNA-binding protein with PD1-like motif
MRRQQQPGPASAERLTIQAGKLARFSVTLEAGVTLNDAIARAMQAKDYRSGVLVLHGGLFRTLRYVIPALSTEPRYAAYYSQTHEAVAPARGGQVNITFGEREGAPFSHIHASWTGANGRRGAGHILPLETVLAEPVEAEAWAVEGAGFMVRPDAETNFSLFTPEAWAASDGPATGALVKIQPNQDACAALEAACARLGWPAARVCGGVGSLVGARFADGRCMGMAPTEVLVQDGGVAPGRAGGSPQAALTLLAVDHDGRVEEGPILPGDNPVLMTFELLLTPLHEAAGPAPH